MSWSTWAESEVEGIRAAGRYRRPHDLDARGPAGTIDGRAVVNFASNDYLGLTHHPAVTAAAKAAVDRWGAGSGAARLIVGSRPIHTQLEHELAAWKGTDAAVLFATGFAANLGVLATFAGPDTLVVSDELNHASIIDGCRLARAPIAVFRHADASHVDELLAQHRGRAVVVSDAVFSMDGDLAPVEKLAEACAERGALLVLDEAHAVLSADVELPGDVVRVGTLSKTLGALGGFAATSRPMAELLVNRARTYIFTTASTPADAAAASAALTVLRSDEGERLRARLRAHVERVRAGHLSPIIPIVVGDEADAVAASGALLERGVLVPAIRPPTVPSGTCRLRLALSAAHTDDQLDLLLGALDDCVPAWRG
jgi:8-amino-7-oxononanoate synthase